MVAAEWTKRQWNETYERKKNNHLHDESMNVQNMKKEKKTENGSWKTKEEKLLYLFENICVTFSDLNGSQFLAGMKSEQTFFFSYVLWKILWSNTFIKRNIWFTACTIFLLMSFFVPVSPMQMLARSKSVSCSSVNFIMGFKADEEECRKQRTEKVKQRKKNVICSKKEKIIK